MLEAAFLILTAWFSWETVALSSEQPPNVLYSTHKQEVKP